MARILFENVNKRYPNGFHAVKDLNLEIADREFVVLLGPSGCGKSTTLNMIAGLEEVSDGGLMFDDTLVNYMPPHKRDVAMVFQSYALYPHKTVFDNIAFGLQMRKAPKDEIARRVQDAAKRLEIAHLLDNRPSQLSGGQRQRVALGRAIVRDPAVFLMDEPLSNLDAALRISMRAEIKELHRAMQTTFVFVTHDQAEALTLADRIVVMQDGMVQQIGTPDEIYEHPRNTFVASFLGSPPINYLDGRLAEEDGGMTFTLTDTQSIILSRAASRPGNLAMPLHEGLHGAAAKKVVTMMLERGWLEEIDADLRKCEPLLSRAPRTKKDYDKVLAFLHDRVGELPVDGMRRKDVIRAQKECAASGVRFANYLVQVLSVVFEHPIDIGWVEENPAKGVRKLKTEGKARQPWPAELIEAFRATAPIGTRPRLIFELLLGTGQRIGDVLKMRWDDIEAGGINVRQGKTGTALWVPFTPALSEALATTRKEGLTLVTGAQGRPLSYRQAAAAMWKLRQDIGAEKFDLHALRYTAAAELAEAGCSDDLIMAVTGHSSLRMVAKYAGPARQRARAAEAQSRRNGTKTKREK